MPGIPLCGKRDRKRCSRAAAEEKLITAACCRWPASEAVPSASSAGLPGFRRSGFGCNWARRAKRACLIAASAPAEALHARKAISATQVAPEPKQRYRGPAAGAGSIAAPVLIPSRSRGKLQLGRSAAGIGDDTLSRALTSPATSLPKMLRRTACSQTGVQRRGQIPCTPGSTGGS